jgi:hypothetical protein
MPSGQYKRSKEELNRLRAMAPLGAKALKSWHKFVKLNPEHPKVLKAIIARNKAHRNNWNKEKYRIRQLAAMHKPEVVARRSKKLKRIFNLPEHRQSRSERVRQQWKDPKIRASMQMGLKRKWEDREYKEKHVLSGKLAYKQRKFNGYCDICGDRCVTHQDHCHATTKLRGILCVRCNIGLGYFRDRTKLLRKAIKYLKLWRRRHALSS